jgi:hypothetical protein
VKEGIVGLDSVDVQCSVMSLQIGGEETHLLGLKMKEATKSIPRNEMPGTHVLEM